MHQMAAVVHKKINKTSAIQMKRLTDAERRTIRDMIANGPEAALGDGWEKSVWRPDEKSKTPRTAADFPSPNAFGRAAHAYQLNGTLKDTPMVAMDMVEGRTARALADPAVGPTHKPGAPILTVLSIPKMVKQLGAISALDLFLGNTDRVLNGNLGNWMYNPLGEVTLIDNVNDAMRKNMNLKLPGAATGEAKMKIGNRRINITQDSLRMLSSQLLADTALRLVEDLCRLTGMDTPAGAPRAAWDAWILGQRPTIEKQFLAGLITGRRRIVTTLTSSRTKSLRSRRAQKAIKGQARKAFAADVINDPTKVTDDYYDIIKARARWLADN